MREHRSLTSVTTLCLVASAINRLMFYDKTRLLTRPSQSSVYLPTWRLIIETTADIVTFSADAAANPPRPTGRSPTYLACTSDTHSLPQPLFYNLLLIHLNSGAPYFSEDTLPTHCKHIVLRRWWASFQLKAYELMRQSKRVNRQISCLIEMIKIGQTSWTLYIGI